MKGVRDKGFVTESAVHEARTPLKMLTRERKAVTLASDQQSAVDEISAGKGVFLLHGVTGSGKTEVYMAVIERMLSAGKTAIMLVPEIALTPQILGLFRARFGDSVALMHSGLNAGERYDEWKRMKDGRAKIAVGPRSAVFAPLENIGVIIIDEEHDSSYVSESNPRYDTKEVAKMRAAAAGAALVLGSATPDMESYLNATEGKYKLITLKKRISAYQLPEMEIVDMVQELRYGNRSLFSAQLADAIGAALARKEQVILFLNRRGFASFIMCKECGYVAKCEDCDVSLTYHKSENVLKFAAGGADVLVGTQMIAKGHDFPNVTLVGILEADAALYFSDYRSSERTFQLITQVAGRAGRADKKGRVILQTYAPRHYVFRFGRTYDYEGFWRKEINTRMVTKFPPFTKVVRVLVASADKQSAVDCTRNIYRGLLAVEGRVGKFVYIGAAKSPVTRMQGLSRYQVLMRLQPEIFDAVMPEVYRLAAENKPAKGSCFAEINPQSLI